jgi:hydrogenase-4 transcriptional activator
MTDKMEIIQWLLNFWRETSGDIELESSCAKITSLLSEMIPLESLMIRELNPPGRTLETFAFACLNPNPDHAEPAITPCDPEVWKDLLRFIRQGKILRGPELSGHALSSVLIPDSANRDILIGPLSREGQALGILVLSGHSQSFSQNHAQIMSMILEPVAAALSNTMRLREVNASREAAEADKNSLLQKLSRKSLTDTIIGAEYGLKQVMERVNLVSRSDVPVMILGETGTGKELISREIHRLSSRSGGPFIRVNCGSIPPELIDSQLFGHEKGSFTGASSTHQGWFERAHGGTLFLDEIGELPLAGQVRLLRIIQDGWLERVGGRQPIHVDVRLVIATHQDLAAMVRTSDFREDLWYRLSVFPILLPALRDRMNDIRALACHFAERAAVRFNLPVQLPDEQDIELLKKYSWPGNIRELGSVIDRAAILGDGHGLKIESALGWLGSHASVSDSLTGNAPEISAGSLDEAMKRHIEQTLARTFGRVEGPLGAAKLLQINPNTLRAKMRKLGIDRSRFRQQA